MNIILKVSQDNVTCLWFLAKLLNNFARGKINNQSPNNNYHKKERYSILWSDTGLNSKTYELEWKLNLSGVPKIKQPNRVIPAHKK